MKKLLLTIACLIGLSLGAFAQGYELSIEGMGSVGPIRCSNNYFGINILNGYRIPWGNGLFAGVGSGMVTTSYLTDFKRVNYLDGSIDIDKKREPLNFFVPVYGSFQYYLSKDKIRQPFVRLDVGYEFAVFRFDWDRKLFDKTSRKHGMYVEPSFGYNFKLKSDSLVKQLRVYASAMNLLTLTGYKGIDPEVGFEGLSPGMESTSRYPTTKTISMGVKVGF